MCSCKFEHGAILLKWTKAYRSEATIKTLGLTARYFPLPQPISRPIDPSGNSLRKRSTIGHGFGSVSVYLFEVAAKYEYTPYTASKRSEMQSGHILDAHGSFRTARYPSEVPQIPYERMRGYYYRYGEGEVGFIMCNNSGKNSGIGWALGG